MTVFATLCYEVLSILMLYVGVEGTTALLASGVREGADEDEDGDGGGGAGGGGGGNGHGPLSEENPSPYKRLRQERTRRGVSDPAPQTLDQDLLAMARQAWRELLEDDDRMREMAADYHALLVHFLKSELGYKHLLEFDRPPTTFQLPDVETLFERPLSDQPRLVCEAMQEVLRNNTYEDA